MTHIPAARTPGRAEITETHRLCVFDLSLTCGHIATLACEGWYPVSVACCERLGGVWFGDRFYPYDAHVEYVDVRSERYEQRPPGSARDIPVIIDRRPRTDAPAVAGRRDQFHSSGRYPQRVGGPRMDPLAALDTD